ncbi:unnamed protein product, partial [Discosporangium mesarthrocarpum]
STVGTGWRTKAGWSQTTSPSSSPRRISVGETNITRSHGGIPPSNFAGGSVSRIRNPFLPDPSPCCNPFAQSETSTRASAKASLGGRNENPPGQVFRKSSAGRNPFSPENIKGESLNPFSVHFRGGGGVTESNIEHPPSPPCGKQGLKSLSVSGRRSPSPHRLHASLRRSHRDGLGQKLDATLPPAGADVGESDGLRCLSHRMYTPSHGRMRSSTFGSRATSPVSSRPGSEYGLDSGAAWFGVSLNKRQRVVELKLVDNELGGSLPDSLGNLHMLRYLHMGRNRIGGTLPASITCLSSLEWLIADGNLLEGPIPPSIGAGAGLSLLVELNLSYNALTGVIPPSIGGLRCLMTLQLSHNLIEGNLPPEITRLTRLVTLGADHNRLEGRIPTGIGKMKALTDLRLGNNTLTGRIPLEMGKMLSLKRVTLLNNRLRGSIPEGLVSRLGVAKVVSDIVPGNRLADVNTAMVLHTRPLDNLLDRGTLWFSVASGYLDLATDVGAAMTFWQTPGQMVSFIMGIIFIVAPTVVMVASTLVSHHGGGKKAKVLITVLQLRVLWEAFTGLKQRRETADFRTAKFVEACFEAAPQMLLQTVVFVSVWNSGEGSTNPLVAFSIMVSTLTLSWEAMNALDSRGWAEAEVKEKADAGASWLGRPLLHWGLLLFSLWLYHVCEVGWRGISLALLALALRGWAALIMLAVWVARAAVARLTEVSDLKLTKLLIKALAACLLDSVWDNPVAYVVASVLTAAESSIFLVAASAHLRDEKDTPLQRALGGAAGVAGAVYAVRIALDIKFRAPLHWGPVLWWGRGRGGAPRSRAQSSSSVSQSSLP